MLVPSASQVALHLVNFEIEVHRHAAELLFGQTVTACLPTLKLPEPLRICQVVNDV